MSSFARFAVDCLPLLAQGEGKGNAGGLLDPIMLVSFLAIGILFYFMLVQPDRRKRKETEQKLANIKKNDHVITIGGICGTVVNASPDSTFVTIRVDDGNNTRLKVLRSAISHVGLPDETAEESKESS